MLGTHAPESSQNTNVRWGLERVVQQTVSQRGSDVLVRPSRCHGVDHGNSFVSSSAAMFSGSRLRNSEFRMLAAAPVDLEDDLSQAMVVIGDDLSDERAKKLLARSHGHPWRIPGRLEVVCEPDKVGYWCGGAWCFKRSQSRLTGLYTQQC